MHHRTWIGAAAVAVVLGAATGGAWAFEEARYPNWKGMWLRTDTGTPRYDPTKPMGLPQQAPLKPKYQAFLEASLADQAEGGPGADPTYTCLAPGMPRIMNNYDGAEFVITPDTTHVLMEHIHDSRRIYTDGRAWPESIEPTAAGYSIGKWIDESGTGRYAGYSIGKWIDESGTGRYDVLEVETRGFKGPRAYDNSGIPLHEDNQSVIKERIYQEKGNPNILIDEITTIDNALTRPWIAIKKYRRAQTPRPFWREAVCAENNPHVEIGGQSYMLSADGLLMPTKKGQPGPDLRYFAGTQK